MNILTWAVDIIRRLSNPPQVKKNIYKDKSSGSATPYPYITRPENSSAEIVPVKNYTTADSEQAFREIFLPIPPHVSRPTNLTSLNDKHE